MSTTKLVRSLVATVVTLIALVFGSSVAGAETAPMARSAVAAQSSVAVSSDAVADEVGVLWQGGFDRDHWWFKISKPEIISIGVGVVCRHVFGPASWFVCPPVVAAVNWALSQWPNAGGYWAELYTNGQVRAGTW